MIDRNCRGTLAGFVYDIGIIAERAKLTISDTTKTERKHVDAEKTLGQTDIKQFTARRNLNSKT